MYTIRFRPVACLHTLISMRTECCLNHDYCSQSNESDCQEISFEILYSQRFCINSLTAIVKGIAETYVSYWSEAKLKAELLLMVVCANSYRITSINLNVSLCILLQVCFLHVTTVGCTFSKAQFCFPKDHESSTHRVCVSAPPITSV